MLVYHGFDGEVMVRTGFLCVLSKYFLFIGGHILSAMYMVCVLYMDCLMVCGTAMDCFSVCVFMCVCVVCGMFDGVWHDSVLL